MGVGGSACGFGSGYNMNSEVIQDHAVVNAQNMAVIMGLAMPWAGYSFDYECSFFNGCEFEQTLTIIFPKPSCGIFWLSEFLMLLTSILWCISKSLCWFSLHLSLTFLDSGQKHNITVYSSASGEALPTFWYNQHLSNFSCTVKLWHLSLWIIAQFLNKCIKFISLFFLFVFVKDLWFFLTIHELGHI